MNVDEKATKDDVIRSADALAVIRSKFEPKPKALPSRELDAFAHALHTIREELNSLRLEIKTLKASISANDAGKRALEFRHSFTDKATPRQPSRLRQTSKIAQNVSALLEGSTLSSDE